MNERLKELRTFLNLSQEEFGKKINLSKPTISALETANRGITDRVINDICQQFDVNETWLRTGLGEMFFETEENVIAALTDQYNLSPLDQKIIESYLNLGPFQRKVISEYLKNLVESLNLDRTSFNMQQVSTDNDIVQIPVASANPENKPEAFDNVIEVYRAARSTSGKEHGIVSETREEIERLKQLPRVTRKDDL